MVGMGVKSVKKKWSSLLRRRGEPAVITRGAELLEMPIEPIIALTIEAMASASEKIGL